MNNLTHKILQNGKITPWSDYWFASILGFLIISMLPVLMLLSSKDDFTDLPYFMKFITIVSWIFVIIMTYGYTVERKLKLIENKLSKKENIKILKTVLKTLNWEYNLLDESFTLAIKQPKSIIKLINGVFIPHDNGISFNLIYYMSYKCRWPYFFGVKYYLYWKLKKEILKTTNNNTYK